MKKIRDNNIKTGLILLALFVMPNATYAERILEDGFDYPIGEKLDGLGGWSESNGRQMKITAGSLSYENLNTSGHKVSIIHDIDADLGLYKKLFSPLQIYAEGDTVYFSFLIHVRNTGADRSAVKIDLGVASVMTTGNDSQIRGIYPHTKADGPTASLTNGTHFIVGKFKRDTFDSQYSQLFLWVDPSRASIGASEDGAATTKTRNIHQGSGTWFVSSLSISLDGQYATGRRKNSSADLDFDEFRIGNSWKDVTPLYEKKPRKVPGLGLLILLLTLVPVGDKHEK